MGRDDKRKPCPRGRGRRISGRRELTVHNGSATA
ncbi:rCG51995, partial [Rattus norvegicus]